MASYESMYSCPIAFVLSFTSPVAVPDSSYLIDVVFYVLVVHHTSIVSSQREVPSKMVHVLVSGLKWITYNKALQGGIKKQQQKQKCSLLSHHLSFLWVTRSGCPQPGDPNSDDVKTAAVEAVALLVARGDFKNQPSPKFDHVVSVTTQVRSRGGKAKGMRE